VAVCCIACSTIGTMALAVAAMCANRPAVAKPLANVPVRLFLRPVNQVADRYPPKPSVGFELGNGEFPWQE
jgi:hypothetical protein